MKKRIGSLALALCLMLTAFSTAFATPRQWETRGSFLARLAQSSGEDLAGYAGSDCPFGDVAKNSGIRSAVCWAYDKWLVNGDENSEFRPDDTITRQEAAAILGRYLDYRYTARPAGCGTGAPDMHNVAPWAQSGVMACWMYGIIDTGDQPEFRPYDAVSGVEAGRWIQNAVDWQMSAVPEPEQKTFADSLVSAVNPEGNWSISPYSVRMCLAMQANGAKGDTRAELLSALQIDDLDQFNQAVRERLARYDDYSRIMALDTANSIWMNQSWFDGKGTFLKEFSDTVQTYYRAETRDVTLADSVEKVNAWVKEKTRGKIPAILTEDNRDFTTALVNAVYFKAAWEKEFPESRTEKGAFANQDGTTAWVDFMHQTDEFGYFSTPGVEAVKLDYRKYAVDNEMGDNWEYFRDADFSMYLILSDRDDLAVDNLLHTAAFEKAKVKLTVPKFKIEYGKAMDDALQALGVRTAYNSDKADLSAMVDKRVLPGGRLYLDTVLHKTYLAIDEKGTEAAAVTAAMDTAGAAPVDRPPLVREFTADKPFYFAIRDNADGELLFVGRYENAG